MANWDILKSAIAGIIKTNGNQEITGQVLQNVLNSIVSSVGENATFAGIATPATNPGTPDGNVFYLATKAGTYSNFNGIVINSGEAVILEWKGSWVKKDSGFATKEKLSELGSKVESGILNANYVGKTPEEVNSIESALESTSDYRKNNVILTFKNSKGVSEIWMYNSYYAGNVLKNWLNIKNWARIPTTYTDRFFNVDLLFPLSEGEHYTLELAINVLLNAVGEGNNINPFLKFGAIVSFVDSSNVLNVYEYINKEYATYHYFQNVNNWKRLLPNNYDESIEKLSAGILNANYVGKTPEEVNSIESALESTSDYRKNNVIITFKNSKGVSEIWMYNSYYAGNVLENWLNIKNWARIPTTYTDRFFNVDLLFPLSEGEYYTFDTAVDALINAERGDSNPSLYKKYGCIIAFVDATKTLNMYLYINKESTSDSYFRKISNWKDLLAVETTKSVMFQGTSTPLDKAFNNQKILRSYRLGDYKRNILRVRFNNIGARYESENEEVIRGCKVLCFKGSFNANDVPALGINISATGANIGFTKHFSYAYFTYLGNTFSVKDVNFNMPFVYRFDYNTNTAYLYQEGKLKGEYIFANAFDFYRKGYRFFIGSKTDSTEQDCSIEYVSIYKKDLTDADCIALSLEQEILTDADIKYDCSYAYEDEWVNSTENLLIGRDNPIIDIASNDTNVSVKSTFSKKDTTSEALGNYGIAEEGTIEFDFYPKFDIHKEDEHPLFALSFDYDNPRAKYEGEFYVSILGKQPTEGIFTPKWWGCYKTLYGGFNSIGTQYLSQNSSSTYLDETNNAAGSQSLYADDNLTGGPILSVRIISPSEEFANYKLITTDTALQIWNGETVLSEYTYVTYPTVLELCNAIKSDYSGIMEVTFYDTSRNTSDIVLQSVRLCAFRVSTQSYDAYPVFIFANWTNKKKKFKLSFKKLTEKTARIICTIDGIYTVYKTDFMFDTNTYDWDFVSLKMYFGNEEFYKIENIKVSNFYDAYMPHHIEYGHGIVDYIGSDGDITVESIYNTYNGLQNAGYEFVSLREYVDSLCNKDTSKKRCIFTFDDNRWDMWRDPRSRAMFNRLNIKPVLFIPLGRIDSDSLKEDLKAALREGWSVQSHSWVHGKTSTTPNWCTDYKTFIQECEDSQTLLSELGTYCIAYCPPEIKLAPHQRNVLRYNYGYRLIIGGGPQTYGSSMTHTRGGFQGYNFQERPFAGVNLPRKDGNFNVNIDLE